FPPCAQPPRHREWPSTSPRDEQNFHSGRGYHYRPQSQPHRYPAPGARFRPHRRPSARKLRSEHNESSLVLRTEPRLVRKHTARESKTTILVSYLVSDDRNVVTPDKAGPI